MPVFLAIIALAAALSFRPAPAAAQVWEYPIAGNLLSCRDSLSVSVLIDEDRFLNNVGYASFRISDHYLLPIIVFNPIVLRSFDPRTQLFWFAHECAHHSLGHVRLGARGMRKASAEMDADCQAARVMRWVYGFGPYDVKVIALSISSLPGSKDGHLPGPQRAQHIMQCAAGAN